MTSRQRVDGRVTADRAVTDPAGTVGVPGAADLLETLPRGRHALTRAQVSASQRQRLLRAMTVEVAERGFAATTAARVYQRAGVSSRAFYENFTDIRGCFLAAYDESVRVTMAVLAAVDPALPPVDPALRPVDPALPAAAQPDTMTRFAATLDRYLALIASEPHVARTFLIEVYAAGPEALRRRVQVHEQFVAAVRQTLAPPGGLGAADRFAVESLVSAITFHVTTCVIAGDLGNLAALRDNLLGLALRLCPWLDS